MLNKLIPAAAILCATTFSAIASEPCVTEAKINGMVCDFCAQSLTKTLLKEEGVNKADVDLNSHSLTVTYKQGKEPIAENELRGLITDAGYDLQASSNKCPTEGPETPAEDYAPHKAHEHGQHK